MMVLAVSIFNRALIFLGAASIAGVLVTGALHHVPAALWFEVRSVYVADAVAGSCPAMVVDRTIRRPFRGAWAVTIMRRTNASTWQTVVPAYFGENDYRPGNALPDDLTVAWWAGIQRDARVEWCAKVFRPGVYRVHTLWQFEPDVGGRREVRAESNPFTIQEASR